MYAPAMGPAGRRSSRPTSRSRRVAAAFAIALCLLVLAVPAAWATARQVGEHQWEGVDRIVAIGDLHGDYGSYMAVLRLTVRPRRADRSRKAGGRGSCRA